MDFSQVLLHSSSLGCLFTEPRDAAAKKAGELSATAKTHLIKVYIREYWQRERDLVTKQMEKGTTVEEDVITLLNQVEGVIYDKNDERKENEWITGYADIVAEDAIIDVKACWDAETFIPKLIEPLDKTYNVQLQAYMWLWDKPKAKLVYGLVNTPDFLLQNELRKLLYNMDVISDESHEYKKAAKLLTRNMIFDDIPIYERIFIIEVPRDEEIISQMPEKVEKARKFLANFHERHLSLNLKASMS